jgi:DNA-binding GntR family transcriptional regulator
VARDDVGSVSEGLTIKRVSTADQLATLLRDKILRGEMQPGTPLQEVTLAASIGVSRNTIREAIRVLVHEGLVRHNVHRGVAVTALSEEDVIDIYRVRRLLELPAAEKVATEAGNTYLSAIEGALDRLEQAANARDWPGTFQADMQFHGGIVAALGGERIVQFFRNILAELRLGLILIDRTTQDPSRLIRDHRELFTLMAEGRREACVQALRAHLADSEQHVREIVATRPASGAASDVKR